MATSILQPPPIGSWRDIYTAALMEGDRQKVPSLISEAELAIMHRARELFVTSGDNIQEEESLDDALYALHALRTCLQIHGQFAEST